LSLDLYTCTVVYPFLIKGWSSRRIADRLKVSLTLISLDQDNCASDVLATRVVSIHVPSTRDGSNVRVHDTIRVNDDGKR
jgi:hypothetical protein